jgi:hypothetical protein
MIGVRREYWGGYKDGTNRCCLITPFEASAQTPSQAINHIQEQYASPACCPCSCRSPGILKPAIVSKIIPRKANGFFVHVLLFEAYARYTRTPRDRFQNVRVRLLHIYRKKNMFIAVARWAVRAEVRNENLIFSSLLLSRDSDVLLRLLRRSPTDDDREYLETGDMVLEPLGE